MAYGIVKKLFEKDNVSGVEVRTAGVMTIPGLLPTQESRQILLKDNVDISDHRSCKMTSELLKRANLVLGMTSFHVQMALRLTERARGKTFLLKEYVGLDSKNSQIQDPMGCTLEVYKKVFREIRKACRRLVKMDLVTPGPPAGLTKKRAPAPQKKTADTAKEPEKKKTETVAKTTKTKKKAAPDKKKAEKQAKKKTAPQKPAAKKPAAKKPTAKKSTAKKPTAKKPMAKKPAVKKPAKKKTAAAKPAPAKTAKKKPDPKKKKTAKKVAKKRKTR